MLERYVLHITLTSGHRRRSFRSEVSGHAIGFLRPLLERAIGGERVKIPKFPGYTITAAEHGRCLILTLWGDAGEAELEAVPILTTGVAGHSRCGAHLWRILHEPVPGPPLATSAEETPPAPWVADRIEVGVALHMDAMEWTGDFCRSVAWTWLEMRG